MKLLRVVGFLVLGLTLLVVGLAIVGVPVSLDPIRAQIEQAGTAAIGRSVSLDGDLVLDLGVRPALRIGELSIANPTGWEGEFLTLGGARLRLALFPLLTREIRLLELAAEDAALALEDRGAGVANWRFDLASPASEEDEDAEAPEPAGPAFELVGFDELSFSQLQVSLARPGEAPQVFEIASLEGSGAPGDPVEIDAQGSLRDETYVLALRTDPLDATSADDEPWKATLRLELAGATLEFEGRFEAPPDAVADESTGNEPATETLVLSEGLRAADLGLLIEGTRLDELDDLLGVSLPPLGPYAVGGRLAVAPGVLRIPTAAVRVGESELRASLSAERKAGRPRLELRLESPAIQLDDFDLGTWSAFGDATEAAGDPASTGTDAADDESEADPESPPSPSRSALLSPESLSRVDAVLTVEVEQVHSGEDLLGAGQLEARLEGGRLVLDPFDLALPGGSLTARAELSSAASGLDSRLELQMREFDYGVLARRIDPESTASGHLSLNVELESRPPHARAFMAHANGHLAFALFPENLEAEVFDLWAANLLLAVLPNLGEASEVNCAGARMRVSNGRLAEDLFVIDTSTMRVGGKLLVDFSTETIEGVVAPVSKIPRTFTASTPVRVKGTFEDFGVGVRPSDVALTFVKMGISPLTAPLALLVRGTLPRDGREVCAAAVDPAPQDEG